MRTSIVAYMLARTFSIHQKPTDMSHNKNLPFLFYFALALCLTACSSDDDNPDNSSSTPAMANVNSNLLNPNTATHRLEFPKVKGRSSLVLVHEAQLAIPNRNKNTSYEYGINYSTEWDTGLKSQRWSCYQMYDNNSIQNVSRYVADTSKGEVQYPFNPLLGSNYGFNSDPFYRSGYDHGHICPSQDRVSTRESNIQTFYLTNMQPQLHTFNAGVWEKMETWLRSMNKASFRDTLYVVKGGTIDSSDKIIRRLSNGLIVPKYYFAAILCKKGSSYMAIGLWFEHKSDDSRLSSPYIRNINELEQLTGIDFFCNLPDDIEKHIETLPRENIARVWGIQ